MRIPSLSCNWQERLQQVADQTLGLKCGYWLNPKYDIMGELRRKVKILWVDSTGHCEKKVDKNICLILCGYWVTLWIYKYKSNGYKEKLLTVNSIPILMWYFNNKFVTIHNECLKIPPSTSVPSAAHEQRQRYCSCVLIFPFFFFYTGGSIQNTSKQLLLGSHLPFVNLPLYSTPQTKI